MHNVPTRYRDRRDAGRRLGQALRTLHGEPNLLVLGLPRGGVPVAYEVATALDAPLDVFVVRKLGVPGHEELGPGSRRRPPVGPLQRGPPARIAVGVPVAAAETCDALRAEVDELVCAATPDPFYAVGLWYADFSQTSDEEVHELLEHAALAQRR